MTRSLRGLVLLLGFALAGCASSETGGAGGSGSPARLVVTADWLNQSLTLLDYDKLIDGQSDAAAAIVGSIDLSSWEPGPVEVEITPDGKTAIVSVGPAFFDGDGVTNMLIGSPEVPPGGALLIVDLASGEATEVAAGEANDPHDDAEVVAGEFGDGDADGGSGGRRS